VPVRGMMVDRRLTHCIACRTTETPSRPTARPRCCTIW
jgi:hypothetical protein